MRPSLVISDRVDFVNDDGLDIAQNGPALFRRKQDVQRLRRGDQNVWRTLQHRPAFRRERVAGPDGGADLRHQQPTFACHLQDFAERNFQVLLNVVAQGLQW